MTRDDKPGTGRCVLAVDDEPDHRLALRMIFSDVPGYTLYLAKDTKEADRILDSVRIDAVILDIALPDEDGITFCKRIKAQKRYRDLPIIALSAFPHHTYREKALAAGCVAFMDKPFEPRKLIDKVKNVIENTRG